MNKLGQNIDLPEIIGGIIAVIVVISFLSILPSLLNPCAEEKAKVDQLQRDLNTCLAQIQNQTQLEQNLNQQCNERIDNATSQCKTDLGININIVNSYRFMFFIYHLSIALSIVLGLNLFKGFLRFEVQVKNRKLQVLFKGVKFVWTTFKWLVFVASILIFLFALLYLFFPNWFG